MVLTVLLYSTLEIRNKLSTPRILKISDFIKLLKDFGSLNEFIKDSNEIFMAGISLTTRTNMLKEDFQKMLDEGYKLKFIVVNPNSALLSKIAMMVGVPEKTLRSEINSALDHFDNLKNYALKTSGSIEVIDFDYIPTLTLMRIKNIHSGQTTIHVELLPHGGGIFTRPAFRLTTEDGELFSRFDEVCNNLWKDAKATFDDI